MEKAIVSRLQIFPFKSLDGIEMQEVKIVSGACLQHDRSYAIVDETGRYINGKNNADIYSLRSTFDLKNDSIHLRKEGTNEQFSFHLTHEIHELETWLSAYFGKKVYVINDPTGRFLDIPDDAGATLVSTASLQAVAGWFEGLSTNETRKRFRASIEIKGVPAFWEDKLFAEPDTVVQFKIGNVDLEGVYPRERCSVPPHNPINGEVSRFFQKTFAQQREAHLPLNSKLSMYGHFYHFAVDCRFNASSIGKIIRVEDEITIS